MNILKTKQIENRRLNKVDEQTAKLNDIPYKNNKRNIKLHCPICGKEVYEQNNFHHENCNYNESVIRSLREQYDKLI